MWVQDVICTDNDESFMCERCGILHPWRMLDNNYWIQGWLYAWLIFAAVCMGIVTVEQIVNLRSNTTTEPKIDRREEGAG